VSRAGPPSTAWLAAWLTNSVMCLDPQQEKTEENKNKSTRNKSFKK
jgi:hypothetical protein